MIVDFLPILIDSILVFYTVTRLFQHDSATRYETRRYVLVLLPVLCTLVLFTIYIRQPLLIALASVLACFAIASLYEIKLWRRICLSVLAAGIFGCCDYFLAVILQFVQFDVLPNSVFGVVQQIIFIILSKLLAMSILNLLHSRRFIQPETFTATFFLATITVPIFSFVALYLLHQATAMLDTLFFRIVILITAILLLGINVLLFYVLDRYEMFDLAKQSLHFTQIHLQDQLGHYNDLFHSHRELRRFRHDLRANSLKYIELLQNGRVEEVIASLQGTAKEIEEQSKGPTTGHSRIDMIVSEMQRKAKPLGFQIQFFFQESAPICMDEMKLCIVLANVIQNGIDACTLVEWERRYITAKVNLYSEGIHVNIENSCLSKADVARARTMKADVSNHGFGLQTCRAIAHEYHGVLDMYREGEVFHFILYIPRQKEGES